MRWGDPNRAPGEDVEVDIPVGEIIDTSLFELGPRETVCPDCWSVHAGECP
jgi:hypothetical protein